MRGGRAGGWSRVKRLQPTCRRSRSRPDLPRIAWAEAAAPSLRGLRFGEQVLQVQRIRLRIDVPSELRGHSASGRSQYNSTPLWSGSRRYKNSLTPWSLAPSSGPPINRRNASARSARVGSGRASLAVHLVNKAPKEHHHCSRTKSSGEPPNNVAGCICR
jgi:hypothetical protein